MINSIVNCNNIIVIIKYLLLLAVSIPLYLYLVYYTKLVFAGLCCAFYTSSFILSH